MCRGCLPGAGSFIPRRELSVTKPEIEARVIEIVSEQLGVNKDQITKETHFVKDLNADSLDLVELVMELEEEFEVSIPEEMHEKIQTVGEALTFIERALQSKQVASS